MAFSGSYKNISKNNSTLRRVSYDTKTGIGIVIASTSVKTSHCKYTARIKELDRNMFT